MGNTEDSLKRGEIPGLTREEAEEFLKLISRLYKPPYMASNLERYADYLHRVVKAVEESNSNPNSRIYSLEGAISEILDETVGHPRAA